MYCTVITVSHAEDDFWRSVVACHDVRRHHEAGAGCASKTKVKNLECAVTLHNDVGRLQILRQQSTNSVVMATHSQSQQPLAASLGRWRTDSSHMVTSH